MSSRVIVMREANVKILNNVIGFVDMMLCKIFDKVKYRMVDDAHTCMVIEMRSDDETLDIVTDKLIELYPGKCIYLTEREGV